MENTAVILLIAFWIVSFVLVNRALRDTGWSIAEALSENEQSSSSRLIAFIFAVIAAGFLMGASLYCLNRLFADKKPELDGVFQLLGSMTTMFIPYGINRLSSALETRGQNPFAALGGAAAAQPPSAGAPSQLQIILTQGSLVAGQSSVITLLGTGFTAGMTALLVSQSTGQTVGQVNGVSLQSAAQVLVTVTPGAASRGQTAAIQLTSGTQRATSQPLVIG
jgi:hypothetical protein